MPRLSSMPRRLRALIPGIPTHIVQRGNNRLRCFFSDNDRRFYLAQLDEMSREYKCPVHAYVLMDNHVHLLATPSTPHGLSEMMKQLGQRFAQFINRVHRRTGALWEGRFFSSVVDSGSYLFTCYRYIELNPVRAGIVQRPEDFIWSSYRANANGEESTIVTPHPQYLALAEDADDRRRSYRLLFEMSLDHGASDEIRKMARGGYAFGSDGFKERMTALSGRPMSPQKRGPKKACPETHGFGSDP